MCLSVCWWVCASNIWEKNKTEEERERERENERGSERVRKRGCDCPD